MRRAIFITLLTLPLVSVAAHTENVALDSRSGIFGISSEDVGGSSYLGVDTRDVTPDRLGALKLKEEQGVEVTMVDQDAPAGKAGLKEHDVILTVNGAAVESVEQLRRVIRETPPGRVVTLGLSRDGQTMSLKVQLAERKNSYAYGYSYGPKGKDFHFEMPAIPPIPPMPDMGDIDIPVSVVVVHSSARSGLMVENLTPQLGDFFGTKDGQGVLVRSVEKDREDQR
jgi:serine protease Do